MRELPPGVLVIVLVAGSACTLSERSNVDLKLHDGEAVGDLETRNGYTGFTVSSDTVFVTIEAVDGAKRAAEVLKQHPDLGPSEIDYRILDQDGRMFVLGVGGDSFANEEWAHDLDIRHEDLPPAADRDAHYELLVRAEPILEDLEGQINSDHYRTLLMLLQAIAREKLERDTFDEPSEDFPLERSVTYIHYGAIYKAALYWGIADHSGTRAQSWNSIRTLMYLDYSRGNHGRYWFEAGMSLNCSSDFSGRTSSSLSHYAPYSTTDTSTNQGGGCSTPFNPYSLSASNHVCNDDAYAQYGNIKYGAAVCWVTCGSSGLRTSSPACSSI